MVNGGLTTWSSVFEDRGIGGFSAENVRYIDSASGLVLTGQQLVMCGDWRIFHSWEGGYGQRNPPGMDEDPSSPQDARHVQLWEMNLGEMHLVG